MKLIAALVFVLLFVFFSCSGDKGNQQVPDSKELWQNLEDANKVLAEYEKQDILDFISRRGWQMQETGSGLWVEVYEKGSGAMAEFGKIATIEYSIMLLNGEVVYSSSNEGKRVFVVGRGGVESGLEEGILLLREGDKARMILPPHLAHGFHGDGERIPRRATIIYQLELLSIK